MYELPVTVLMPVYNAEPYLKEAIESILHQTYSDFEFLIINDGSTDSSKDIILSYHDSRIRYIENESNMKLIATLNKGIGLAKGKYIVRMDADDISLPERLKLLYGFMESHPNVGLCGSWFENFSKKGNTGSVKYTTDDSTIRLKQLHQIHLSHGTCIFRTDALKKHQLCFNPEYIHAEDYELWTRIAQYTKLANFPQVLYMVRDNRESVSNVYENIQKGNTKRIIINQFRILKHNFTDDDYALYMNFAYSEFSWFNKQKVKQLNDLLTLLLAKNSKTLFLPHTELQTYWSDKLFHICYNVADCMDIWKTSVLYDKRKMTLAKMFKNIFKANKA